MAELTCHQRIGSLVNRTLDLKPRGNCPSRPLSMVGSLVAAWCTSLENDNANAQAYCGNAQCQSIYLGEFNAFHFGGLRLPWLSGASYVPFNGTETLWYSAVLHSKGMDSCCRALRLSPSVREARSTAAGNLRSRAAYELPHLHRWQLTLLERRQLSSVFLLFRQLPSKFSGKQRPLRSLSHPACHCLGGSLGYLLIGLGGRSCRAHPFYSRAAPALLWAAGDRVAFTLGHGKC